MGDDDSLVMKLFFLLPLLVVGLFVRNHLDWVSRNLDYLAPVGALAIAIAIHKVFPELWTQMRSAIPVVLILLGIVGGILYVVFGGGADAVVGFGAKAREQHIESLQ